MPIKLVETHKNMAINKIVHVRTGQTEVYQTCPVNYDGTDVSKVVLHSTLSAARDHLGVDVTPRVAAEPKKKMRDLPQNTEGYRADRAR